MKPINDNTWAAHAKIVGGALSLADGLQVWNNRPLNRVPAIRYALDKLPSFAARALEARTWKERITARSALVLLIDEAIETRQGIERDRGLIP